MPDIAIVIPVFNDGIKLRRCLESVAAGKSQPSETIVVDDAGDEDLAFVERDFAARVVRLSQRVGPAGARNEGVRHTSAEIIFFVDADVIVMPDALTRVRAAFRDPAVSAVIGSYDDEPTETNFLSQYRNLLHHYTHQNGREQASTFWGACGAIRRSDFEEMGGFDGERYGRPSIEDIELGYRLRAAAKKIVLDKRLQVRHQKRWEFIGMVRTDFALRALPWSDLILRTDKLVDDLNTNVANRFSTVVVLVLLVFLLLLPFNTFFLVPVLLASVLLLVVNADFYGFLAGHRGTLFAARAVPMHWLLLLLSGVAFGLSLIRVQWDRLREHLFGPRVTSD